MHPGLPGLPRRYAPRNDEAWVNASSFFVIASEARQSMFKPENMAAALSARQVDAMLAVQPGAVSIIR